MEDYNGTYDEPTRSPFYNFKNNRISIGFKYNIVHCVILIILNV